MDGRWCGFLTHGCDDRSLSGGFGGIVSESTFD